MQRRYGGSEGISQSADRDCGGCVEKLKESTCFELAEAVNPGFINLKVKPSFVADYLNKMAEGVSLGVERRPKIKDDHD